MEVLMLMEALVLVVVYLSLLVFSSIMVWCLEWSFMTFSSSIDEFRAKREEPAAEVSQPEATYREPAVKHVCACGKVSNCCGGRS